MSSVSLIIINILQIKKKTYTIVLRLGHWSILKSFIYPVTSKVKVYLYKHKPDINKVIVLIVLQVLPCPFSK